MTATTSQFNHAATPGIDARELKDFMSHASDGNVAGMQAFVDKYGPGSVDAMQGEPAGMTALLWASKAGNIAGITFLLDHGADIHRTDSSGVTPLIYAGWLGRTEAAKLLLQRGAKIDTADDKGETFFSRAAQLPAPDTFDAIHKYLNDERQKKLRELHEAFVAFREGLGQDVTAPPRAQFKPRAPQ